MSYENVELESTLQTKCNDILRKLKVHFLHLEKGVGNKGRTHRKGVADLLFWHNFKSFAVELKTAKGIVKPDQIEWLGKAKMAGVYTAVVRSEDEFMDFLKMHDKIGVIIMKRFGPVAARIYLKDKKRERMKHNLVLFIW